MLTFAMKPSEETSFWTLRYRGCAFSGRLTACVSRRWGKRLTAGKACIRYQRGKSSRFSGRLHAVLGDAAPAAAVAGQLERGVSVTEDEPLAARVVRRP
jgi:predicted DNA-binding WGR domain protein